MPSKTGKGKSKMIKLDKEYFLMKWRTSSHRQAHSVGECATAVGISESGLYSIESGRRLPGLETFFNMCVWAGLNPRQFLTGFEEMTKKSDEDFVKKYPLSGGSSQPGRGKI